MDPSIPFNWGALPSILGRVIFFVGYSTLVVLLVESQLWETEILGGVGSALAGFLSVVTGLMLSLRSESSSTRWKEGRNLWDLIGTVSRTLVRNVSLGLPPCESLEHDQCEQAKDLMGLIVAFPYALKHHLRGEKGISYPDLEGLLPPAYLSSLRRTNQPVRFALHPIIKQIPSPGSLHDLPLSSPPSSPPPSHPMKKLSSAFSLPGPSNLPLSILRLMQAYLNGLGKTGVLAPGVAEKSGGMVDELTRALGSGERIRDTHVPLSISIHFQQMLSLYLLSIPPQLAHTLRYWTIPVTAIAAFCFLGVDGIGATLGEPFGEHPSALPLDKYTDQILQEALELGGPVFVQGYLHRLSRPTRVVVDEEEEKANGERFSKKEDGDGDGEKVEKEEERIRRGFEWDERRADRWLPVFN